MPQYFVHSVTFECLINGVCTRDVKITWKTFYSSTSCCCCVCVFPFLALTSTSCQSNRWFCFAISMYNAVYNVHSLFIDCKQAQNTLFNCIMFSFFTSEIYFHRICVCIFSYKQFKYDDYFDVSSRPWRTRSKQMDLCILSLLFFNWILYGCRSCSLATLVIAFTIFNTICSCTSDLHCTRSKF